MGSCTAKHIKRKLRQLVKKAKRFRTPPRTEFIYFPAQVLHQIQKKKPSGVKELIILRPRPEAIRRLK